jgi:uncharacterized iron-regulated membrane protein
MRDRVGRWLVEQFAVFGVHFQNWMAVALVIVVLSGLYLWLGRRFGRSDMRGD